MTKMESAINLLNNIADVELGGTRKARSYHYHNWALLKEGMTRIWSRCAKCQKVKSEIKPLSPSVNGVSEHGQSA